MLLLSWRKPMATRVQPPGVQRGPRRHCGSSTSLPSVATPAPIRPASPFRPSLSSAPTTEPRMSRVSLPRRSVRNWTVRLPLRSVRLGRIDRGDRAGQHRSGRHEHLVALVEVDERGGLDPVFDARRPRCQRGLQAHVEFGADRQFVGSAIIADLLAEARRERREAHVEVVTVLVRDALAAPRLHAQVGQVVLQVLQLAVERGGWTGATGPLRPRHRGLRLLQLRCERGQVWCALGQRQRDARRRRR